ncbi:type II toxin-antitoxin system RelE/ParE family toxin [Pannonibacter sp. Pt2-lr]
MPRKTIKYVNNAAKKAVQKLPLDVAADFLNDLNFVAAGKDPRSSFKSLPEWGAGVVELIENGSPAYRVVYCAKYLDTVYILHAFTKTTNGVDRAAKETVMIRYKEMMSLVREAEKAAKKRSDKNWRQSGSLDLDFAYDLVITRHGRPQPVSQLRQISDQPV